MSWSCHHPQLGLAITPAVRPPCAGATLIRLRSVDCGVRNRDGGPPVQRRVWELRGWGKCFRLVGYTA